MGWLGDESAFVANVLLVDLKVKPIGPVLVKAFTSFPPPPQRGAEGEEDRAS